MPVTSAFFVLRSSFEPWAAAINSDSFDGPPQLQQLLDFKD